jgi:hypothetical protein
MLQKLMGTGYCGTDRLLILPSLRRHENQRPLRAKTSETMHRGPGSWAGCKTDVVLAVWRQYHIGLVLRHASLTRRLKHSALPWRVPGLTNDFLLFLMRCVLKAVWRHEKVASQWLQPRGCRAEHTEAVSLQRGACRWGGWIT